jgi:hypothetical protein
MIEEPAGDDPIRTPLNVNSTAPPGAQEPNPTSFQWREGIGRTRSGHPLADDDLSGPGPVVQPIRVGGSAPVVR